MLNKYSAFIMPAPTPLPSPGLAPAAASPLAPLRPLLRQRRLHSAQELRGLSDGSPVLCCGIVTLCQQPQTAKGVIFVSLEDETGVVQVIVYLKLSTVPCAGCAASV